MRGKVKDKPGVLMQSHKLFCKGGDEVWHSAHTFDNFVVEDTNRSAYEGAMLAADNPGKIANPLIICGSVGQGKTHLMAAIAERMRRRRPRCSVLFLPADELVVALRDHSVEAVRRHLLAPDLLIVESVTFLKTASNAATARRELVTVTNVRAKKAKQVVLEYGETFSNGTLFTKKLAASPDALVVEIEPLSLLGRLSVIRRMAASLGASIPDDLAAWIAEKAQSPRIAEGAVIKIAAHFGLTGAQMDVETGKKLLAFLNRKKLSGSTGGQA